MDANKGDMAGFAKKKGWQSVAPEFRDGKAVLVVKTGAALPKGKGGPPKAPTPPAPKAKRRTKPRR